MREIRGRNMHKIVNQAESWLRYVYLVFCFLIVFWFGYWSFVFEWIIWKGAAQFNIFNYFMFGLGVAFLALRRRILDVVLKKWPWKEKEPLAVWPKQKRGRPRKGARQIDPKPWKKPKMIHASSTKLKIPGLLGSKRIMAGILLVINFIFGESALTAGSFGVPVAIMFLANSFILLDYLWKTRTKRGVQIPEHLP